jgi:Gamma-glutamyltranspeptidase
VRGSVKGLVYAEEHFGNLGLKRVIEPAIRLAHDGYPGECIEIDLDSGRRLGASDPRNDTGKAVGY